MPDDFVTAALAIQADPKAACLTIRRRLRMTQQQLAQACNVHRGSVQYWEFGRKPTDLHALDALVTLYRQAQVYPDGAMLSDDSATPEATPGEGGEE